MVRLTQHRKPPTVSHDVIGNGKMTMAKIKDIKPAEVYVGYIGGKLSTGQKYLHKHNDVYPNFIVSNLRIFILPGLRFIAASFITIWPL